MMPPGPRNRFQPENPMRTRFRRAAVPAGSALDDHACVNTTSVYTPPRNFPMLPDRLSTDLTSLIQDQDRQAMVVEMVVDATGAIGDPKVYRAGVRNRAKLAYRST